MAVAVTSEQLEEFTREGYTILEGVFSERECEEIIAHIEDAAFMLQLGEPTDGQMLYRPMMHLADPFLQEVCTDARWAGIVVPLLGHDVRLYWEQSVAKPPEALTELPWHQDNGYTPLIPEQYLTCWLALDDADVDNGCIWVIPRSHLNGTAEHRDGGSGPFRVGHVGDEGAVAAPVKRGDVLCFSSLIMHRSGPNTSGRNRRSWIIQYCQDGSRSALSGRVLDDRLLVARGGQWLDEPVRDREFDLLAVLANYQTDARGS